MPSSSSIRPAHAPVGPVERTADQRDLESASLRLCHVVSEPDTSQYRD
jgi:hypothetical protein